MITNAAALGVNPRLYRIKLVSRVARYVCFGAFAYSIGFFLLYSSTPTTRPPLTKVLLVLLMVLFQAGIWFLYWKLSRIPHIKDRIGLPPLMVVLQIMIWLAYWRLAQALPAPGHTILPAPGPNHVWHDGLWILYQISMWVWYWKMARLFRFYERGRIFAAETIRCIKTLGLLCVAGWLLGSITRELPAQSAPRWGVLPPQFTVTNLTTLMDATNVNKFMALTTNADYAILHLQGPSSHVTRVHYIGFFSFDFGTGVNFGPFFIGVIIVLIAWIMEEGRKIQEEQELTV
jgi:hypothetical protein